MVLSTVQNCLNRPLVDRNAALGIPPQRGQSGFPAIKPPVANSQAGLPAHFPERISRRGSAAIRCVSGNGFGIFPGTFFKCKEDDSQP
jgi:hypothetical protein